MSAIRLKFVMRILLFVLIVSNLVFSQHLKIPKRIIPKNLFVELCQGDYEGKRIPLINFYIQTYESTFRWSSRNIFTDLYIKNDSIFIDILGYDHVDNTEFWEKNNWILAGGWQYTNKSIKILPAYFTKSDTIQLFVKLNLKTNLLFLVKNNLEYKLLPRKIINLKLTRSRIIIFPKSVYIIYISGDINPKDSTYHEKLKNYVRQNNYILAHSLYPQIPVGDNRSIFIILNYSDYEKVKKKGLGNLPGFQNIYLNIKKTEIACYNK